MLDAAIPPELLSEKLGVIQARAGAGRAESILFGVIGEEVTAKGVVEALKPIPDAARLVVRINSPGGSLPEGLAIFNALSRRAGVTEVVVEGIAASAASLIAMAGKPIVMPANAFLMLHLPRTIAAGDADDFRAAAAMLDRMGQSITNVYATRSGQSVDKVRTMLADETWLTAEEAVSLGFADQIEAPLQAVARLDLSPFHNVPAALAALAAQSKPGGSNPKEKHVSVTEIQAASFTDIQALAVRAGLDADFIVAQLEAGATIEEAREAALDAKAAASPTRPATLVGGKHNGRPKMKLDAMTDALAARMGANGGKPLTEQGKIYMQMPAVEMARELLLDGGQDAQRWSRDRVADVVMSFGSYTTSDFPNLLQYSGNRVLAEAYRTARSPLRAVLCKERDVSDFRGISVIRLTEYPSLDLVQEHEEVRFGSMAESKEGYKVDTFAKAFAVTRQAIINDDLQAFEVSSKTAGAAAAATEARVLVSLLTSASGAGPTMGDGYALFHVNHGNLGATVTGPITSMTLSAARSALRKLKDTDGTTAIDVTPKYVMVGPDRETEAEQMLLATTVDGGATNPWAGKLELLVEPRLTGNDWYVFADPAVAPVLEVAYLIGSGRAPQLATFEEPNFLGVRFRVIHDFGAGAVGWRGAYRNPGAA